MGHHRIDTQVGWAVPDAQTTVGPRGVHSTPYAGESYRATAPFRKAKRSLRSDVESSVSQRSPVASGFSPRWATGQLLRCPYCCA